MTNYIKQGCYNGFGSDFLNKNNITAGNGSVDACYQNTYQKYNSFGLSNYGDYCIGLSDDIKPVPTMLNPDSSICKDMGIDWNMSVYDVKNPIATTAPTAPIAPTTTKSQQYIKQLQSPQSQQSQTQTLALAPAIIPNWTQSSNLSNALTDSYNTINTSRFNTLDKQDRLNGLEKRMNKIKTDLASLNTSKKTTSSSSFTFY